MNENVVQNLNLQNLDVSKTGTKIKLLNPIALIGDVPLKLSVSVGNAQLCVEELFNLSEGQILTLDSESNQPLSLLLAGKVVAYGRLVVVDNNFGIQITQLNEQE